MKISYVFALCVIATVQCLGANTNGWTYKYSTIVPGTRSEYVSGALFYKGKIISPDFGHVITPIGEFDYVVAMGDPLMAWVPAYPGKNGDVDVTGNSGVLTEDALNGKNSAVRRISVKSSLVGSNDIYLKGTLENPPEGVGGNWFYVVEKGLWVNPEKIDEVIKSKVLESLH